MKHDPYYITGCNLNQTGKHMPEEIENGKNENGTRME
jgi:hypothetical protein